MDNMYYGNIFIEIENEKIHISKQVISNYNKGHVGHVRESYCSKFRSLWCN